MATSIPSVTSGSPSPAESSAGLEKLGNTDTFLKLLVAQIRNQNPLNPTDGTQFVAQLAQFSQLEQTIAIRTDVQALRQDAESGAKTSAPAQP